MTDPQLTADARAAIEPVRCPETGCGTPMERHLDRHGVFWRCPKCDIDWDDVDTPTAAEPWIDPKPWVSWGVRYATQVSPACYYEPRTSEQYAATETSSRG